jgi:hypothetical protein
MGRSEEKRFKRFKRFLKKPCPCELDNGVVLVSFIGNFVSYT